MKTPIKEVHGPAMPKKPRPLRLIRQLAKERSATAQTPFESCSWELIGDWAKEELTAEAEARQQIEAALSAVTELEGTWERQVGEREVPEFTSFLVFCQLEALANLCKRAVQLLSLLLLVAILGAAVHGDDFMRPVRARSGRREQTHFEA